MRTDQQPGAGLLHAAGGSAGDAHPYATPGDWRLACGWLTAEIQRYAGGVQTSAAEVGGAYGRGVEGVEYIALEINL